MNDDRKRWWIAPSILALALILAVGWGYGEYRNKNQLGIALENHYQRLFFDIKKHVENVQVNLSKALVSQSRDQNVLLLSQIMNEAYFAQDKLGQMPVTHAETSKTEKFLNQVADYSFELIKSHLDGKALTKEQRKALGNLRGNSATFNEELAKLQSELADRDFMMSSLNKRQSKKVREGNEKILMTSIGSVEQNMAETPELIYDGPFSDQMINRKPVGLSGGNVSKEQAKMAAKRFFGEKRVNKITSFEEGKNAADMRIPAHTFNIEPANASKELAVYIGVTRQGGKVLWMANSRPVSKANISIDQAQDKALKFLKNKGFDNMEPNYYLKSDNTVLFNFAAKEKDVTIYPDLVKVKVALDNGEAVGFDASSYYLNHRGDRNIEKAKITSKEARSKIRTNYDINSIRLALIPKGKEEVLCYEFKGKYEGSDYIIYINALDGKEEQILQLIKDDNGTLTF
ncbi:MAG: germination protein YpeB [Tissierellia bacterium]|nr:germination protein YpeB [Tissierellia bacterium]